jgi:hypothetical protein
MLSRVAAPRSGGATRSVAQNERRKPRANERRYVGSCNELGATRRGDAGHDKRKDGDGCLNCGHEQR